jgi:hypothetical protein
MPGSQDCSGMRAGSKKSRPRVPTLGVLAWPYVCRQLAHRLVLRCSATRICHSAGRHTLAVKHLGTGLRQQHACACVCAVEVPLLCWTWALPRAKSWSKTARRSLCSTQRSFLASPCRLRVSRAAEGRRSMWVGCNQTAYACRKTAYGPAA